MSKERPVTLEEKKRRLQEILSKLGKVAIAYSGGTDSSLLLTIARDLLGLGNVLVLHNQTELQKPGEATEAINRAIECGFSLHHDLLVINSQPLSHPEIVRNDQQRCYYCKRLLYTRFLELTKNNNFPWLLDGTNSDDLHEVRPGKKAIAELKIRTPLADAGLDKQEIRLLSRSLNLVTWNRPSASCLATRISYDSPLRIQELHRIATLEEIIEQLGFKGCRVKPDQNKTGSIRIQIQEEDFSSFFKEVNRTALLNALRCQGIHDTYLDIRGRETIRNDN